LATYLAFPTQVSNYVDCLRQAQNSSDQRSCMTKFYKSIHVGAKLAGEAQHQEASGDIKAETKGPLGASEVPARLPTGR
jgi:hypothetical protein